MNKHVVWGLGIAATIATTFVTEQAHAVITYNDPLQLKAPGVTAMLNWAAVSARRAADQHIYRRNVQGSLGAGWTDLGAPAGGAKSGPSSTTLNQGTDVYAVLGNDNNVWVKVGSAGGWANWGSPPPGAGSAVAVGAFGTQPFGSLYVAVLGNDNVPYTRKRDPNGGAFSAWIKVGNNSVLAPPAISVSTNTNANIYSLGAQDETLNNRCVYMSCYTNWFTYGAGLSHWGASGTNWTNSQGFARVAVAAIGLDNRVWTTISVTDGQSFPNFTQIPGGPVAASSPGTGWFPNTDRLITAVSDANGNKWVYNAPYADKWTNIGQP